MINRRLQSMTDVNSFLYSHVAVCHLLRGDCAARREANIEGRLRGRKEANTEVNYVLNHFQINAFLRFLRKLKHSLFIATFARTRYARLMQHLLLLLSLWISAAILLSYLAKFIFGTSVIITEVILRCYSRRKEKKRKRKTSL